MFMVTQGGIVMCCTNIPWLDTAGGINGNSINDDKIQECIFSVVAAFTAIDYRVPLRPEATVHACASIDMTHISYMTSMYN
jgi:hypothetical protein